MFIACIFDFSQIYILIQTLKKWIQNVWRKNSSFAPYLLHLLSQLMSIVMCFSKHLNLFIQNYTSIPMHIEEFLKILKISYALLFCHIKSYHKNNLKIWQTLYVDISIYAFLFLQFFNIMIILNILLTFCFSHS